GQPRASEDQIRGPAGLDIPEEPGRRAGLGPEGRPWRAAEPRRPVVLGELAASRRHHAEGFQGGLPGAAGRPGSCPGDLRRLGRQAERERVAPTQGSQSGAQREQPRVEKVRPWAGDSPNNEHFDDVLRLGLQ
ncbi:unnamed protein product, partial [Prorocentrum cordatum]